MQTAILKGKRVLLGRIVNGGREIIDFENAETRFLPEVLLKDLEIQDTDDDLKYVQDSKPFSERDREWLRQHRQLREQKAVRRPSKSRTKRSSTKKKTARKKAVSPEVKARIRKMPENMQKAFMKDMGIDSLD